MPEGEAQGDDRCSYQHGLYECRYLLIYEEFLYHLGVKCEIHSVPLELQLPARPRFSEQRLQE